jgi:hypothetical protein
MRYAVCPRCWLKMKDPDNEEEAKDYCPRCLGRLGMQVPLYRTAGPARPARIPLETRDPSRSGAAEALEA